MFRFFIGLVTGLVIGAGATGYAATCVGSSYLLGWSVTKDGAEICSDPFVWTATKEIECD